MWLNFNRVKVKIRNRTFSHESCWYPN